MKKQKKHLVFVYGSLMKGLHNARFLKEAAFIGNATAAGLLYNVANGHFPGMVHGAGVVHGEVYEVDEETLEHLDRLEGYSGSADPHNHYIREEIEVALDLGSIASASAYFYNLPVKPDTFIPSGNWKDVVLPMGYEAVEVKGYPFVITEIRELSTNLEGYPFKYDVRHDDEEWEPCSIEKHGSVFVNCFGTLFSKEKVFSELQKPGDFIPIDEDGFAYL